MLETQKKPLLIEAFLVKLKTEIDFFSVTFSIDFQIISKLEIPQFELFSNQLASRIFFSATGKGKHLKTGNLRNNLKLFHSIKGQQNHLELIDLNKLT